MLMHPVLFRVVRDRKILFKGITMKALNKAVLIIFVVSAMLALNGCKGEVGISSIEDDLAKSLETIKAEAAKMDVNKLKAKAVQFKDAIISKEDQVNELMIKLRDENNLNSLMEEGTDVKTELEALMTSVKAFKERYDIYMDYLIEKKGDITGLSITE